MKKILPIFITIFLICFMVLGCSSNTTSVSSMSFEDAISISKQSLVDYFNTIVNEDEYNLNIQRGNSKYFSVTWSSKDGNISAYTNIDIESKKVIQASIYNYSFNSNDISISDQEIEDIANKFLTLHFADKKDLLALNSNSYFNDPSSSYSSLFFYRIIDGIEFPENFISVGIDKKLKIVNSFSINWDEDTVISTPSDIPTKEEALEIFKSDLNMKLAYVVSSQNPQNPILAYLLDYSTGDILDCSKKELVNLYPSYNPFLGDKKKIDYIVSDNQGKIIDSLLKLDYLGKAEFLLKKFFPDDFKLNPSSFSHNTNGYDGIYFEASDSRGYLGNIYLDNQTLELINLYIPVRERVHKGFTPEFTWDEGYYKAIEIIASLYPDRINDLDFVSYPYDFDNYDESTDFEPIYYYTFSRNINGIPFLYNNISIGINVSNSNLTSINFSWNDELEFNQTKPTLSSQEALEKYLSNTDLKLSYFTSKDSDGNKSIILGYTLSFKDINSIDVNALTGEFILY